MADITHVFDADNLPPADAFKEYVKVGTTKLAGPFDPPVMVQTREGAHLTSDEAAYIALDAGGMPYPVAQSIVEKIYRLADETAAGDTLGTEEVGTPDARNA